MTAQQQQVILSLIAYNATQNRSQDYRIGVVVEQIDLGLQKAKDSYFESVKLAAQGLDPEYGPWVVAEGITPGLFEMWIAKQESRWKLAYEDDDGGVILLYGDPSPVHEGTSGFISKSMIGKLTQAGGEAGTDSVDFCPSPLCQLVNSQKEPDFAFQPSDYVQCKPTLVCEVAYMNESMIELRRELSRWTEHEDLAKMCIGVHINTRGTSAAQDPYLTLFWKHPGSRHDQLSFGRGTACIASDLDEYRFRIPFDSLFAQSTLDLVQLFGQCNHVTVDLFKVRQVIIKKLVALP